MALQTEFALQLTLLHWRRLVTKRVRITWFNTSCYGKTESFKVLSQVSCCWTLRQESWGRLRATEDSCGTIPGVWQLLWRRLQFWDRSGFSVSGEWMWLCVGHILCRTGSLDTLLWTHVLVLQIFVCVAKRGQAERIKDSSVMSPTRLNQLPEKQWLTRRFTPLWVPKPPYAEQNKLLFVYYQGISMNLWNRNCQCLFGYTGFIIY